VAPGAVEERLAAPAGVTVTTIAWDAVDTMPTDAGETESVMPEAGVTCTEAVAVALRPSPATVTVIVPAVSEAVVAALSVSVAA
jgi:hypothetical protein